MCTALILTMDSVWHPSTRTIAMVRVRVKVRVGSKRAQVVLACSPAVAARVVSPTTPTSLAREAD